MKQILYIAIIIFIIWASPVYAGTPVGEIGSLTGTVSLSGDEGSQSQINIGDTVHLNDTVTTSSKSTAQINLNDSSILSMKEKSKIYISEFLVSNGTRQSRIEIGYGKVKANIQKMFKGAGTTTEFYTPTAVIGIRGTQLVMEVRKGSTKVYCLEGNIRVTNPDFPDEIINVAAGMATDVLLGQIPSIPSQIPADVLNGLTNGFIPAGISNPKDMVTDKVKSKLPSLPFFP
ncbi:FecR family protein [bacterium]|nr:FecR family protein [bacterium]